MSKTAKLQTTAKLLQALTKKALKAGFFRVLCLFLLVQSLLVIPIGLLVLREEPSGFYPRIHGGPDLDHFDRAFLDYITIAADANGFISSLIVPQTLHFDSIDEEQEETYRVIVTAVMTNIEELQSDVDYILVVTSDYLFYRDTNAVLGVPLSLVSAWALAQGDYRELFNHLALYNRYFASIVAPVLLLILLVIVVTQALMILAAAWLFGYLQRLSGNMTYAERVKVCVYATVPASFLGLVIGVVIPVVHIFAAQLIMIYIAYQAMKEV
ncbi:MAG: hypothetical protein LBC96_03400 [Lachnospiraceae bacterium]|jgi:hypothetical protein|nr:hypothetical protein [Lachnospiraceae bacterium]